MSAGVVVEVVLQEYPTLKMVCCHCFYPHIDKCIVCKKQAVCFSDLEKLDKYLERMGNTERVNLSGLHEIFLDKPDDCSNIIVGFLNDINED